MSCTSSVAAGAGPSRRPSRDHKPVLRAQVGERPDREPRSPSGTARPRGTAGRARASQTGIAAMPTSAPPPSNQAMSSGNATPSITKATASGSTSRSKSKSMPSAPWKSSSPRMPSALPTYTVQGSPPTHRRAGRAAARDRRRRREHEHEHEPADGREPADHVARSSLGGRFEAGASSSRGMTLIDPSVSSTASRTSSIRARPWARTAARTSSASSPSSSNAFVRRRPSRTRRRGSPSTPGSAAASGGPAP